MPKHIIDSGSQSLSGSLTLSGNISATGTITGTNLVYNIGDQNIAGDKTFTDDVSVVGQLTAPNQTVAGNSSVLTSQLSLQEEMFSLGSWFFGINTNGGSFGTSANQSRSGSSSNGWGRTYLTVNPTRTNATGANASFPANTPIVVAVVGALDLTSAISGSKFRLIIGDVINSSTPNMGNVNALSGTNRGFGIEGFYSSINNRNELRLFSYDGNTYSNSSTSIAYTGNFGNEIYLILSHDGLGNLRLFSSSPTGNGTIHSRPTLQITHTGAPTSGQILGGISTVCVNHGTIPPSSGDVLFVTLRSKILTGLSL